VPKRIRAKPGRRNPMAILLSAGMIRAKTAGITIIKPIRQKRTPV
jgi:hypothetical protein